MDENNNVVEPQQEAEAPDRKEILEQQFEAVEKVPDYSRDALGRFTDHVSGKVPLDLRFDNAPESEAPPEPSAWSKPPASWKKEHHDLWSQSDPRMQEYIHLREEQMRSGVQPLLGKAKYADGMEAAIAPYLQTLQGLNVKPHEAVGALMKADHLLRTSPHDEKVRLMLHLAQEYGINLNGASPQGGAVDPGVYQLRNELNNMRGEMNGWKEQSEQAENSAMLGDIQQFAQVNEYFEQARPAMAQLLKNGMADSLEDAYIKAIRMSDDLFSEVQQRETVKLETARRSQANRAAKAAQASAVGVRSSTPGIIAPSAGRDRRSILMEQFNELDGRL